MRNLVSPEINASSMADIAFLLLIFFLVTTTLQVDIGILKKLPKESKLPLTLVNERNVLEVSINSKNEILIENSKKVDLKDLTQIAINFIDNAGGTDANGNICDWCHGKKDKLSSDHPAKAIIELQGSRNTSYGVYVAVQNEILVAYNELRNKLAITLYETNFNELENSFKKDKNNSFLKKKIKNIKDKYPVLLTEKEPENNLNNP